MKILFKNALLVNNNKLTNVEVTDKYITDISTSAKGEYDRIIDVGGNLLTPPFYNAHCHAAMTCLRGYAENLPLDRWLHEKIFPAEEKLTDELVYSSTMLAIAEMIACGVVSFSDMYMFEGAVGRAVAESKIKANLSRSVVSFDELEDMSVSSRIKETERLISDYHGYDDGRIKIDLSLHAEYTNNENSCRYIAQLAKEKNLGIQIHASETESEHNECIKRHAKTPIEFFMSTGVLDVPTCAAHCVFVTENDMSIMRERGTYAVHNPVSNLKLASGVMPLTKMLEVGVPVALGTDGASSNNKLSILREMQLAAILHNGVNRNPCAVNAKTIFGIATVGGAKAQGRFDCGEIAVGKRADLLIWNLDSVNNIPCFDSYATLVYSANENDVILSMADGVILYEKGEYKTIDIEKIKDKAKRIITKTYF